MNVLWKPKEWTHQFHLEVCRRICWADSGRVSEPVFVEQKKGWTEEGKRFVAKEDSAGESMCWEDQRSYDWRLMRSVRCEFRKQIWWASQMSLEVMTNKFSCHSWERWSQRGLGFIQLYLNWWKWIKHLHYYWFFSCALWKIRGYMCVFF